MFQDLKNILKHTSIFGAANLLQKGIGFIMIPVYTYYLTPSDYGILELMDLSIMIISMLLGMRLGSAIIRYYHHYESEQDRQEVFSTAFISITIMTIIVVLLLECFTKPIAGLILGDPKYYRYFQIIFVSMGFQTIATCPESLLLAQKKSVLYSTVTICTLMSYLTFNILFIVGFKMGVMGMLLSMIITKFFNTSSQLILIRKHIRLFFSREKFIEMARFGLPLVPAAFFMFSMHYSDRFFIRKFVDLSQLGVYSLGYKFGMILSILVSQPFFSIWNTYRFEIAKTETARETFSRFFTYYIFIISIAGLGLSVLSREVVFIMAPSEYQGAAIVIAIIVASYIAYGTANFLSLGIMITFKTKFQAYAQILAALFNILANYIFIKHFGVIGAAFSTLISFAVLSMLTFFISQRIYHIRFEYFRVLAMLSLASVLFGVSLMIHTGIVFSIFLKILIICSFPAILYFGNFFKPEEKEKIGELIRNFSLKNGFFKQFFPKPNS